MADHVPRLHHEECPPGLSDRERPAVPHLRHTGAVPGRRDRLRDPTLGSPASLALPRCRPAGRRHPDPRASSRHQGPRPQPPHAVHPVLDRQEQTVPENSHVAAGRAVYRAAVGDGR